jgi:5-oxopent-3-ene-1,2,5-tricarboxylate decarboxylase/2-hydroxyhepta-2,4-diene-1,7-dioate isomerase
MLEGRALFDQVGRRDRLVMSDGATYDANALSSGALTWLPPVEPTKMVGLVLNYADHANELGLSTSEDPILFLKPLNTLMGNRGEILYPKGVTYMHYEAELAVVIGSQATKVSKDRAFDFVKGYTIANEVTVRDYITNTFRPPVKAKGCDTFCPLGPYLVTPDEIPDVNNLELRTFVNGQLRQKGNTKDFIHSIPKVIEYVTAFMTLEPNDVILTGTPKGISPIVPGDTVEIEIDGLGRLSNKVVAGQ